MEERRRIIVPGRQDRESTVRPPRPPAPPIKSPKNWSFQGPGIGAGILSGVSVFIWPNERWIAYGLFGVGLALIFWPVVAWAFSVFAQFVGLRAYRRRPNASVWQLILAVVTFLAITGVVTYAGYEIHETNQQARADAGARARRIADTQTILNALIDALNRGRSEITAEVESDDEFYDWLIRLGIWQQRTINVYDRGILVGALTAQQRQQFSLVSSTGVGPRFNPRHAKERGHHFARLEVLQEHVSDLQNAVAEMMK